MSESDNNTMGRSQETAQRLIQIHVCAEEIISSPYSHDVIELILATIISTELSKEEHSPLVWLIIIGNPSAGKTEVVLAFEDLKNVYFLDSLTENSFLSGYVEDKNGSRYRRSQPKPQLLDDLNWKTLVIKDLTTLFSGREEKVKQILGDLQSIYDGKFKKATGTLGVLKSSSTFPIVAAITPVALAKHQHYMSMVGGRFLMYRIPPLTDQERQEGFDCAWDQSQNKKSWSRLRKLIGEHVEDIQQSKVRLEPESDEQQQELNQLATLLARGRGITITEKVSYLDESSGEERHRYEIVQSQIEEPFRVVKQLRTLGRALARVHGRTKMTDHELELLRKVVLSSIPEMRAKVLRLFAEDGYRDGLTVAQCSKGLSMSESGAAKILKELVKLELVVESHSQNKLVYSPVPELAKLLTRGLPTIDHVLDLAPAVILPQNSPHTNTSNIDIAHPPVGSLVRGGGEVSL